MTTEEKFEETVKLIKIGFCQPKFYKPSVWNKAKKIMEWLCDNLELEVQRHDYGRGKGKYTCYRLTDEMIERWANYYLAEN